MLPVFKEYVESKKYDFGTLDNEIVFDYLLLELPFSFWQNGGDCNKIPDSTAGTYRVVNYICNVVPQKFFSKENRLNIAPAFYMFYHEFGYYEYNIEPFKQWLQNATYPNEYFAPTGIAISFDDTYLKKLNVFLKTQEAESVFFIYGEFDPWSSMQETQRAKKFISKGGSHKSRVADLSPEQKTEFLGELKKLIK